MPELTGGAGSTWNMWISTSTSTSATTVWPTWVATNAATGTVHYSTVTTTGTDNELWEAQRAAAEERRREEAAQKKAAEAKAGELLQLVLLPAQWDRWERDKQFELLGSDGGHYRISRGVSGNVARLDERGQVTERLCGHPPVREYTSDGQPMAGTLPAEDVVIAQVLALTTDEPGFRQAANISRMAA